MKGHMQDGKFHPHIDYKKVSRKKREPFPITKDGVKITQKELIQMQRADVGRRKRVPLEKGDMVRIEETGEIGTVIKIPDDKHLRFVEVKIGNKLPLIFGRIDVRKVKIRKERNEAGNEEFELYDILEDITGSNDPDDMEVNFPTLEKVMKENIQEILEREKIWKKGDYVSFPVGSLQHVRPETSREEFERTGSGDSGFYQYDFDLINVNNTITYQGTSFGDISAGSMIDMTIEVRKA